MVGLPMVTVAYMFLLVATLIWFLCVCRRFLITWYFWRFVAGCFDWIRVRFWIQYPYFSYEEYLIISLYRGRNCCACDSFYRHYSELLSSFMKGHGCFSLYFFGFWILLFPRETKISTSFVGDSYLVSIRIPLTHLREETFLYDFRWRFVRSKFDLVSDVFLFFSLVLLLCLWMLAVQHV